MLKVLDHETLLRDPTTNAILVGTAEGVDEYKEYQKRIHREKSILEMNKRIDNIENNQKEIIELLSRILNNEST